MATKEHLDALNQGIDGWNAWRKGHPDQVPDLSGTELQLPGSEKTWNLRGCRLNGATLSTTGQPGLRLHCAGADLSNVTFKTSAVIHALSIDATTKLDGASFAETTLNGLDLTKVALTDVSFFRATLTHVKLSKQLTRVDFGRASLTNVDFGSGRLVACSFASATATSSRFEGTHLDCETDAATKKPKQENTLEKATLTDCSFVHTDLNGCKVHETRFIDSDLRGVQGLFLDETILRGTVMSPGAKDPWSVLRRKYTGANMLFTLIALVVFFFPWISQAFYWVSVNQVQAAAIRAADLARTSTARLPPDPQREAVLAVLEGMVDPAFERCVKPPPGDTAPRDEGCQPVWKVLLGLHEGWWAFVLGLILLLYNAARAALTWLVAPLRDEEKRSWHTPPMRLSGNAWARLRGLRSHYGWMLGLHRFVAAAFYVAVLAAVFHLGPRLLAPVWTSL